MASGDCRGANIVNRGRATIFASIGAQVAAGAASILLTVAVARTQSPAALGAFAVTIAVQALLMGLCRSFTSDIFLFSRASYADRSAERMLVGSTSAVLILALLSAMASALLAWVAFVCFGSGQLADILCGVALLVVPTSLQQHLRVALVAGRRHVAALLTDVLALIGVSIGAVVAAYLFSTVLGFILVWAVASSMHAVVSMFLLRVRIRGAVGKEWLSHRWRNGLTFATDFAVTAGLAQFLILFVSAISGIAAAGALRGAQTLVMPVTLVTRGAGGPVATVLVRRIAAGARKEAVFLCALFSFFCFASALACAMWLVVPEAFLRLLLGESAEPARTLVVPTALAMGAVGVATGAGYFLRADGGLKIATALKVVCLPFSAVAVVWGTWASGAAGAQIGFAVGELLRALLAWGFVRRRF